MSTDINFKSLIFKHDTVDFPFLAIATILSTKFSSIKYQTKKNGNELMILPLNVTLSGELTITRFLARTFNTVGLYGANFIESAQVDEWLDKIEHVKNSKQFDNFFNELNKHLTLRTFLVGHQITLADIALFYLIFKDNKVVDFKVNTHVKRWFDFVSLQEVIKEALTKIPKEVVKEEGHINIGSMGSYEKIVLENAVMGQVKVRFPPEPSGFLHMGHFKAVLLNSYYKNHYKGKFILRFDDTNPSNEKEEYVEAIMEDLKALGVEWDGEMTRTSQYFDLILEKAVELIKNGDAFVDDTPQEKMSEQRREQIDSVHRNNSIEKNLEMWQEMIKGSEFGLKCVLRAKIDMKHKIAALRDPSLARCMDVPHPVTGDKFKCYPLYDLACPIVDSIEGVTHALRDSQYCDRKDFYTWVIDKLKLRKVYLKEFSRINFEYTLLSKRKLDFLIKQGAVEGWDSPAVPTVRGILNRGMTPKALKMFIESQGASLNMTNMSMDKLWAINKKLIDPEIPRFFAVKKPTLLTIDNFDVFSKENIVSKVSTRVKNFPKEVIYTKKIFMEQKDARSLKEGEEVVFMDFGVVAITKIEKNGKVITSLSGTFLPNGDFKDKNKKKVTWLADIPHLKLNLVEYDHLITTKKLAKDLEDWKTVIRPKIKYETSAIGDPLLKTLKKRDKIQLERLGNFICNQPWTETTPLVLVNIPDGHQGAPSVLESKLQKLKRLESQNNKDSKDTKN